MLMKLRNLCALPLAAALVAGCGQKPGGAPATQANGAKTLKVALLIAGPPSDHGWNGLAHDAVQKLKADTGATVTEQQTKSKGEIEAALRNFASQGYDLVIAHGNEYGEPALAVAKDFPKVHFVISSGRVKAPNVTSLIYKLEDATYVLGVLAANMSKTGKAACVGGMEFPPVASTFYGFEQGAHAAKPGFKVTTAYLNSWDDTAAGKQQAATLINQGNDFIFHNADAAGLGVFQAVDDARKAGTDVWALGSNADQSAINPGVILASAVLDPSAPLEEIVKEVQANTFQGKNRLITMQNGGVTVAFNPALKDKIPAGVMKMVEDAEARIKSGALVVKQSG
jgi:basic membrane lipoprotein Med (substrate-binding protein (PBP1-ABC) superfamily)